MNTACRSNASRATVWLWTAALALAATFNCRLAAAANLVVANPSFETPAFTDGAFATSVTTGDQGGFGWTLSESSGVYNPPAQDYSGAGGGGTPAGADGAQVGFIAGSDGDYVMYQRLAGPDGAVGNGDDPLLEPFTIYTLTANVGQRALGNLYGGIAGGYDIQLRAGSNVFTSTTLARESQAVPLQPGGFIERTITWDSALANPEHLGLPLTILFRKPLPGSLAATEYDNVRLDATFVSPTADFDNNDTVDGADLATWKAAFNAPGAVTPEQGDFDRNLRIDGHDFLAWQQQVGSAATLASAGAMPEPDARGFLPLLMLAFARLALPGRRR